MSPARDPGRDAALAYAFILVSVAVLVRVPGTLPGLGHVGSAVVAFLFLQVPMTVGGWRGEDLPDYGFVWQPVRRNLLLATLAMAVIFPLFAVGYVLFYDAACDGGWLATFAPRGMCRQYGGLAALHLPALTWPLVEFILVQVLVVALTEELFFRGFLHKLLEARFPPTRRWLGGGVGLALVLSSAAFALVHLPKDGDARALATFFPGLLFGWMRSKTGSIVAPLLTHAGANITVRLLELALQKS